MKRGHHHGDLREALLTAGQHLLDREGIEGVTIRACARSAGVSHAAPINHFPDRRALLTALAVQCMDQLDRQTRDALALAEPAPRARLEALWDVSVAYGQAHPNRYRLMGRADLRDAEDPALKDMLERLLEPIAALGAQLVPGRLGARSLVLALCAALTGYVFMMIDGNLATARDPDSGQPLHRAILDLLLTGQG